MACRGGEGGRQAGGGVQGKAACMGKGRCVCRGGSGRWGMVVCVVGKGKGVCVCGGGVVVATRRQVCGVCGGSR